MTATSSTNGRRGSTDPTDLRQDIERTRAELGETVEALAAKADVKARAQDTVHAAKVRVLDGVHQVAASAAHAGHELRDHPRQQLRSAGYRLRRAALGLSDSVRERPAPWLVAAGFLALAVTVARFRRARS